MKVRKKFFNWTCPVLSLTSVFSAFLAFCQNCIHTYFEKEVLYLLNIVRVDDIQHMRKVVAYCKRHLAQEEKAKQDEESKSYKSLKNWGHDAKKA